MKLKTITSAFLVSLLIFIFSCQSGTKTKEGKASSDRWSMEKASGWSSNLPWLRGCDFIPGSAINQLEMWQAETFDQATIDRELGWAKNTGI